MIKISIITICYNNEKDIRTTLESVVNQTYPNIEYIVKDGGSKDKSLSIINEYKDRIAKIISEPDKGIYDAINIGIKAATGDIVGLIHAGDRLYNKEVVAKIASFYSEHPNTDISYGWGIREDGNGKIIAINRSPSYSKWRIKFGWMAPHESIFVKKDLFEKYGYYRTDLGGAADYEWFVRYFYRYGKELKINLIKEFIHIFSMGGESTKNYKSKLNPRGKHSNVVKRSWIENGLKPLPFLTFIRPFWLIKRYIISKFSSIQLDK